MTEDIIIYIIIVIIGTLVVLSFAIGLEKMIKIILGNYILSSICLAASQSINIFIKYLNTDPEAKYFGIKNSGLSSFLNNGQTMIIMVIYGILLWLIYKNSRITIAIPEDEIIKKSLYLFFVPLTVVSFILTIQIAIMGVSIFGPLSSIWIGDVIINNTYLQIFIKNTPVRILLHGIATILITSEIKINIKTDI